MGQGPEPVEGQAIFTLWRDESSLLQNSAVLDRRYRIPFRLQAISAVLQRVKVALFPAHNFRLRRRRAFVVIAMQLRLIVTPASIGLSSQPFTG